MCSNYEAQLQAVQEDLKNTKKESKRLERLVTHEQQAAENALKYQIQLEEALKVSAEEAQTEV